MPPSGERAKKLKMNPSSIRPDRIVVRRGSCTVAQAAELSCAAFERRDMFLPELWLLEPTTTGTLSSALQASTDAPNAFRRASGGAEAELGPGVLHVLLSLPAPSIFEPIRVDAILNRHVRPLLRAISRTGALAHYFGRDWISARHRPVALLGFAHESATQRTLIEAFVGANLAACARPRPSYLGHSPATLAELVGRPVDVGELADRVEEAVLDAHGLTAESRPLPVPTSPEPPCAPRPREWTRTHAHEGGIGPISIGVDSAARIRIGGELCVSFDALTALEARLESTDRADPALVAAVVEQALGASSVALFGVRSLDAVVSLVLDSGVRADQ